MTKAKNGQKPVFMTLKTFENKEQLEIDLSQRIANCIENAIEQYGDARILLSGGSTPFGVYQKLAEFPLDWSKVSVGLVDDRMVPIDHPSSNYGTLRSVFEKAIQNGALVYPMVRIDNWSENLALVASDYKTFMNRLDFIFLGMGNDGHTASLFPNDESSEADLLHSRVELLYTTAPVEPKHRMTCSKALLCQAENSVLMLVGEEKMKVFNEANEFRYPIHYFTEDLNNLEVYYSK